MVFQNSCSRSAFQRHRATLSQQPAGDAFISVGAVDFIMDEIC